MAEPLSIASASFGVLGGIATLLNTINTFTNVIRNAQTDIKSICDDLKILQTCLQPLNDERTYSSFPVNARTALLDILKNCWAVIRDTESVLERYVKDYRGSRRLSWYVTGKARIAELRQSLQVHVSAIQIALQIGLLTRTYSTRASAVFGSSRSRFSVSSNNNDPEVDALRSQITVLSEQLQQLQQRSQTEVVNRSLSEFRSYAESITDPFNDVFSETSSILRAASDTISSNQNSYLAEREQVPRHELVPSTKDFVAHRQRSYPSTTIDALSLIERGWSPREVLETLKKAGWNTDKVEFLIMLNDKGLSTQQAREVCEAHEWSSYDVQCFMTLVDKGFPIREALTAGGAAKWDRDIMCSFSSIITKGWSAQEVLEAGRLAGWRRDSVLDLTDLVDKGWSAREVLDLGKVADWRRIGFKTLKCLADNGVLAPEALQISRAHNSFDRMRYFTNSLERGWPLQEARLLGEIVDRDNSKLSWFVDLCCRKRSAQETLEICNALHWDAVKKEHMLVLLDTKWSHQEVLEVGEDIQWDANKIKMLFRLSQWQWSAQEVLETCRAIQWDSEKSSHLCSLFTLRQPGLKGAVRCLLTGFQPHKQTTKQRSAKEVLEVCEVIHWKRRRAHDLLELMNRGWPLQTALKVCRELHWGRPALEFLQELNDGGNDLDSCLRLYKGY